MKNRRKGKKRTMAKYTELFAEYVKDGGALPSSSFALVQDFEDLFKERYCACEIGFETEELFAMKLDMKARLVMPVYAKRIAAVDAAINKLQAPSKVRTENRVYGEQHSQTHNDGSATELPFDATTAKPSNTSTADGSADINEHEDNATFTDFVTIDENIRIIETLSSNRKGLIEECLNEFKPLFMGVY